MPSRSDEPAPAPPAVASSSSGAAPANRPPPKPSPSSAATSSSMPSSSRLPFVGSPTAPYRPLATPSKAGASDTPAAVRPPSPSPPTSKAAAAQSSLAALHALLLAPSPPSPPSPEEADQARSAMLAQLEPALRRSGANELVVRLGRRAAVRAWYAGEKRGRPPGSEGAVGQAGAEEEDKEEQEWEGEELPEGVGTDEVRRRLEEAMAELGGTVVPLLTVASPPSFSALLRLAPPSLAHLPELRIAVLGNVDAGKSTTLGVLTRGGLDDGRGKARVSLFRHKHEVESGRTSSVGMEILGFDEKGKAVLPGGATGAEGEKEKEGGRKERLGWEQICQRSAKVVSFIDLAGHERYLKTTIFGMTACAPDYCMLMVGANAGLVGMSKEHLAVALALNVPVVVCITKIDMTPAHVLAQTKTQLAKILRSPGCRRTPVFVDDERDVLELSQAFVADRLCPIFLLSNVTGESLPHLRSFLNLLPPSTAAASANASGGAGASAGKFIVDAPLEYAISDVFSVPFVGTVVNGVLNAGSVKTGDAVLLGPDSLGQFVSTTIKSIQRKRASVGTAEAGQSVSFALKRVRRTAVRKGMVIVARPDDSAGPAAVPRAVRRFEGQVLVLYHNTTIQPGYQAVMHTGAVRQTCRIITMDHPKGVLRTGDRASAVFEFCSAPEYVKEGDKLLFREGKTKGLGVITKLLT